MSVVRPGEGARLTALGSTYTTKADAAVTRGAYVLVEEEFWGETTPLHTHVDAEEAFYVLSGQVAQQGEDALLEQPERLVALAEQTGTQILGDYPSR